MSGTEKYPLLVVGKSKKPRCFPTDPKYLPVDYDHSKNAWMTGNIFQRWLQKWDTSLHTKKRKICLLVDNCPAHPADVPLTNIILKFLPPNAANGYGSHKKTGKDTIEACFLQGLLQLLILTLKNMHLKSLGKFHSLMSYIWPNKHGILLACGQSPTAFAREVSVRLASAAMMN